MTSSSPPNPTPLKTIPLIAPPARTDSEMESRARSFFEAMNSRRTVRHFRDEPVPRSVIEWAIRCAGTAPSGANKQPWTFVAIADPAMKRKIRIAAEEEERAFYTERATPEWLEDLAPLGTDADKPFLETAPWLIAAFQQAWKIDPHTGAKRKNYYVPESASLACGFLLAALHHAGLVTLTHTPSPMGFLRDTLKRPNHERALMLIVAGRPALDARVPDIQRKPLEDIAVFYD